ncbi:cytospin-A-like isoform X1 [Stegodyphus dumicola]|uniref:cytospin-A-like isoform X1 n=1 Tax=Stegodyphus dumicola TaxID=202533 RepID=UPI0015B30E8D|nr:cytospin-A-like isoform X1 [Stegodyphus dumicola]XP_035218291.1 cytospin-A-like isoform X1 [Stegodyphus dumicola]XP_035218292.1 cytospin-A-like isoform X1 [Stegodyphus dumicola]XP_035218293.1 cytospin-A-like isoform X1 [Stegodyphus dumicola]XP_035218294.1 cytospin-A-like isoform X1 [Stegodyphus dumicola]
MLRGLQPSACPKGNMKNNKPLSGKPTGNITASKNPLQGILSTPRGNKIVNDRSSTVSTNLKKTSTLSKPNTNCASSSQESLSGTGTSVRRKISAPAKVPAAVKLGVKNDTAPIRLINNLQIASPHLSSRKTTFKRSNMRRAVSKDSVDLATKDREKENVKIALGRNKNSNNCITILQMEKEKAQMEQQISELVKNAESKKAEIATLKMEISKLKDLKSDDAVDQLRQELEAVQSENQTLKERLLQLGVSLEMTALSDNQKEQILIQRSLSGSFLNLDKSQNNSTDGPKSLDMDVGEASGVNLLPSGRSLPEWERGSSSSLSEMSVACLLQDRIMQMEETHHSTNEELQATLQELTDLQDQLADLQLENERMSEEKAVLLESLCSQTEKLEECRTQITQLKQLLFQEHNQDGQSLSPSERECTLVDLLKKAQEAHDVLLMKQEQLSSALQAAKNDSSGPQTDLLLLRDRVKLLESTVESVNADKRMLEAQLTDCQEQLSASQIEVSQLKLQLENEQQKVLELQREREAGATSELNTLLQETRKDKEKVEERAVHLQEQLAHSQREVARLKDQLHQLQEENMVRVRFYNNYFTIHAKKSL